MSILIKNLSSNITKEELKKICSYYGRCDFNYDKIKKEVIVKYYCNSNAREANKEINNEYKSILGVTLLETLQYNRDNKGYTYINQSKDRNKSKSRSKRRSRSRNFSENRSRNNINNIMLNNPYEMNINNIMALNPYEMNAEFKIFQKTDIIFYAFFNNHNKLLVPYPITIDEIEYKTVIVDTGAARLSIPFPEMSIEAFLLKYKGFSHELIRSGGIGSTYSLSYKVKRRGFETFRKVYINITDNDKNKNNTVEELKFRINLPIALQMQAKTKLIEYKLGSKDINLLNEYIAMLAKLGDNDQANIKQDFVLMGQDVLKTTLVVQLDYFIVGFPKCQQVYIDLNKISQDLDHLYNNYKKEKYLWLYLDKSFDHNDQLELDDENDN